MRRGMALTLLLSVSTATALGAAPRLALAADGATEQLPEPRASYTADTVVEIAGDRVVHKVYHAGGMERQELNLDGLFQITILRPDLGRAFVIQPGLDDYIELPIDEAYLLPLPSALHDFRVESLGEVREGGEDTVKYRLSSPEQEGKGAEGSVPGGAEGEVEGESKQDLDVLVWSTADGIIMRVEGEIDFEGMPEGILLLRRNVQRGELDPTLFEPEIAQSTFDPARPPAIPDFIRELGESSP